MNIVDIKRLCHRVRLHHRNIIHPSERIGQHSLNHRSREPLWWSESKARRSDLLAITLPKARHEDGTLRSLVHNPLLSRHVATEIEIQESERLVGGSRGEEWGAGV